MMRRILTSIALACLFGSQGVWAQDVTTDVNVDNNATTTTTESNVGVGALGKEGFGFKPEVGAMVYNDALGNTTSRGVAGLDIDMNLSRLVSTNPGLYVGPQTGIVYSHLGSATSNFFGTSPSSDVNNAGANMLLFPVNLKVGYNLTDSFRISAHGGGNVMYRSVANVMDLGASSFNNGSTSTWSMFPNAGGDVEFGLGKSASLLLRPDWTSTPGNDFFTGTLGLGIAIG